MKMAEVHRSLTGPAVSSQCRKWTEIELSGLISRRLAFHFKSFQGSPEDIFELWELENR